MNKSEFYLFGNDIQKSPSQFIHNYVFDVNFNNATYEIFETNYLDSIKKVLLRKILKELLLQCLLKIQLYIY